MNATRGDEGDDDGKDRSIDPAAVGGGSIDPRASATRDGGRGTRLGDVQPELLLRRRDERRPLVGFELQAPERHDG
eukprot:30973-Pelagococcus_subviridis.AAC.9